MVSATDTASPPDGVTAPSSISRPEEDMEDGTDRYIRLVAVGLRRAPDVLCARGEDRKEIGFADTLLRRMPRDLLGIEIADECHGIARLCVSRRGHQGRGQRQ